MTIQPISAASVALYLTPADLRELDVDPETLTAERTLELARDAFRQAGDNVGVLQFLAAELGQTGGEARILAGQYQPAAVLPTVQSGIGTVSP